MDNNILSEDPIAPTPWPYIRTDSRTRNSVDHERLQVVLGRLAERENELSTLKAQLELQEHQIER